MHSLNFILMAIHDISLILCYICTLHYLFTNLIKGPFVTAFSQQFFTSLHNTTRYQNANIYTFLTNKILLK